MELRLTYQEISDLVEKKAGRALPVIYGGPNTVRVSYDVNVFIKTASVGIDLTIERIEGQDIYLSYDGGAGIEFMVRQAIMMAKNRPGGDLIEPLDGNHIRLCLSKNAQAGSIFDHITLEDIRFDEQYAIIQFAPKNM